MDHADSFSFILTSDTVQAAAAMLVDPYSGPAGCLAASMLLAAL